MDGYCQALGPKSSLFCLNWLNATIASCYERHFHANSLIKLWYSVKNLMFFSNQTIFLENDLVFNSDPGQMSIDDCHTFVASAMDMYLHYEPHYINLTAIASWLPSIIGSLLCFLMLFLVLRIQLRNLHKIRQFPWVRQHTENITNLLVLRPWKPSPQKSLPLSIERYSQRQLELQVPSKVEFVKDLVSKDDPKNYANNVANLLKFVGQSEKLRVVFLFEDEPLFNDDDMSDESDSDYISFSPRTSELIDASRRSSIRQLTESTICNTSVRHPPIRCSSASEERPSSSPRNPLLPTKSKSCKSGLGKKKENPPINAGQEKVSMIKHIRTSIPDHKKEGSPRRCDRTGKLNPHVSTKSPRDVPQKDQRGVGITAKECLTMPPTKVGERRSVRTSSNGKQITSDPSSVWTNARNISETGCSGRLEKQVKKQLCIQKPKSSFQGGRTLHTTESLCSLDTCEAPLKIPKATLKSKLHPRKYPPCVGWVKM